MQRSVFSFVPFILLIVPILEIGVFILVGGQIGVAYTLLGIVLTAIIGSFLLRKQGLALLTQVQSEFHQGNVPGKALAHGVMLLVAGLLLLTPGFVTDSLGFLLFVPPIRDGIWHFFAARLSVQSFTSGSSAGFDQRTGAHFYHSEHFYSSDQQKPSKPHSRDASIIDLDEDDFDEVSDKRSLNSPDASSPWADSDKKD
ncbi:MAG: FxsA family protein [Cohaesibacter sp.]|nr:FxsA family protein [Cohaesibacter sp.]